MEELKRIKTIEIDGKEVSYTEYYFLDHYVDEDTGMIDKTKKEIYHTKDQVERNLKNMREAIYKNKSIN